MSEQESSRYIKKKGFPTWLAFVILLAGLVAVAIAVSIYHTRDLVTTAEGQLSALRSKDVARAYYEYTSKDFKASTPLEQFHDFVKSHPALARNQEANFNSRSVDKNIGTLHGTLMTAEGNVTPIEYKLVKEDDKWKILSMRLVETGALTPGGVATEHRELVEPIDGQLAALRSNDISRAYFGFASKEFQETTPLKAFKEFVKNYPILTKHLTTQLSDGQIDGNTGVMDVTLNADDGRAQLEYKLIKEDGKWKIWSLRLNVPGQSNPRESTQAEAEDLITPIEAQLAHLRAGDVARAYNNFTTREFQASTSLDAFREFVKAYPALSSHQTAAFEQPTVQQDSGVVTALLQGSNGQQIAVEFQLIRMGKGWKIWSMQVLTKPTAGQPPTFNTADLVNAIETQLASIRAGDLSKAYYAFTSKEFQRSTPAQAFEHFVNAHPSLAQNQVANFINLAFKNGIGTFQGTLTSADQQVDQVEYDLIYEDGKWRILSIQIKPMDKQLLQKQSAERQQQPQRQKQQEQSQTDVGQREWQPEQKNEQLTAALDPQEVQQQQQAVVQDNAQQGPEIVRLVVGNELDSEGHVVTARSNFPSDESKIHVDLYVRNETPGGKTELTLEHLETKTQVPAVEAVLNERGDAVLSFIFTPPTRGWPHGNYELIARSSNGGQKIYYFRVQ